MKNEETKEFKDAIKQGRTSILVAVRNRRLTPKEIEVSKEETIKILNN